MFKKIHLAFAILLSNNCFAQWTSMKDGKTYLTDLRTGKEYLAATSVEEITKETKALDLDLTNKDINGIPLKIFDFPQIEVVKIYTRFDMATGDKSKSIIKSIPKEIAKWKELRSLSISETSIEEIPIELNQLTNLENLHIGTSKVKSFPCHLSNLKNLKYLSLSYNQIGEMPECVSQFTNLVELDMIHNQLEVLPSSMIKLTNLKSLSLAYSEKTIAKEHIAILEKNLPNCKLDVSSVQPTETNEGKMESLSSEVFMLSEKIIREEDKNNFSLEKEYGELINKVNTLREIDSDGIIPYTFFYAQYIRNQIINKNVEKANSLYKEAIEIDENSKHLKAVLPFILLLNGSFDNSLLSIETNKEGILYEDDNITFEDKYAADFQVYLANNALKNVPIDQLNKMKKILKIKE